MFHRGALTSDRKEHDMSDTAISSAIDRIKQDVTANDVVVFMKGTPDFPQCGFSGQVAKILAFLEVPYKGVNVLEDPGIREGVKQYANWPTIPQLYIKGEFVGGCDIIREMFQSGELAGQLKAAGVPVKDPQQS
jgi:monothiol glutaredoxin